MGTSSVQSDQAKRGSPDLSRHRSGRRQAGASGLPGQPAPAGTAGTADCRLAGFGRLLRAVRPGLMSRARALWRRTQRQIDTHSDTSTHAATHRHTQRLTHGARARPRGQATARGPGLGPSPRARRASLHRRRRQQDRPPRGRRPRAGVHGPLRRGRSRCVTERRRGAASRSGVEERRRGAASRSGVEERRRGAASRRGVEDRRRLHGAAPCHRNVSSP
jgi:hypothetical protein